ncbi:hypothetical protein BGZ98_003505 [Dissophora globulifera]|nr:hypothetical protein BGZ98_003505 [Dissophora globulifera]
MDRPRPAPDASVYPPIRKKIKSSYDLPYRKLHEATILDRDTGSVPMTLDALQTSGPFQVRGWVSAKDTIYANPKEKTTLESAGLVYIYADSVVNWIHEFNPVTPMRPTFWVLSDNVCWYKIEVASLLSMPVDEVLSLLRQNRDKLIELGSGDRQLVKCNFYQEWVTAKAKEDALEMSQEMVDLSLDMLARDTRMDSKSLNRGDRRGDNIKAVTDITFNIKKEEEEDEQPSFEEHEDAYWSAEEEISLVEHDDKNSTATIRATSQDNDKDAILNALDGRQLHQQHEQLATTPSSCVHSLGIHQQYVAEPIFFAEDDAGWSEADIFICPIAVCLVSISNSSFRTTEEFSGAITGHVAEHDLTLDDAEAKPNKESMKSATSQPASALYPTLRPSIAAPPRGGQISTPGSTPEGTVENAVGAHIQISVQPKSIPQEEDGIPAVPIDSIEIVASSRASSFEGALSSPIRAHGYINEDEYVDIETLDDLEDEEDIIMDEGRATIQIHSIVQDRSIPRQEVSAISVQTFRSVSQKRLPTASSGSGTESDSELTMRKRDTIKRELELQRFLFGISGSYFRNEDSSVQTSGGNGLENEDKEGIETGGDDSEGRHKERAHEQGFKWRK